jgi:predicted component of type VI protein secretion system
MNRLPEFNIQLVHMQGPFKGEIQSFLRTPITIGRHTSCEVCFPPDLAVISRKHADIVREGNRFKIIDHSSNGTLVNGKPVKEAFLRDGDVITLSPKGPKFSFMAETTGNALAVDEIVASPSHEPKKIPATPSAPNTPVNTTLKRQTLPNVPVKAQLTIQFGPSLLSFDTLPITIGRGAGCDFPIEHPGLTGQHVRIHFLNGDYLVEDMTGRSLARKNDLPLTSPAPLHPEDIIALSPQGPYLNYLGEGRFAEHHNIMAQASHAPESQTTQTPPAVAKNQQGVLDSLLKRIRRN